MSQAKAIEDMDFKELRQEVQRLSDKLARMERVYADTLENLDDDNLSAQTLKEKEGVIHVHTPVIYGSLGAGVKGFAVG